MNEREGRPSSQRRPPVSEHHGAFRGERRFFGVLVFLGVVALFFGFYQTLNTIRNPFRPTRPASNQSTLGPTAQTISSLSKKDTDGDGLSDFDELYQYQTSPYLADSDSDNDSDQVEVFGGTDPNCAKGTTCSTIAIVGESANLNASTANSNASAATNTAAIPGGFSLDDLRLTLRNAGAPASTIDSLSDEELLQLYREVTGSELSGLGSGSAANSNTAGGNTNAVPPSTNASTNVTLPDTLDQSTLQNLTSDQIREFLRRGGADEALLLEVDDATLRDIFNQALTELPQTP